MVLLLGTYIVDLKWYFPVRCHHLTLKSHFYLQDSEGKKFPFSCSPFFFLHNQEKNKISGRVIFVRSFFLSFQLKLLNLGACVLTCLFPKGIILCCTNEEVIYFEEKVAICLGLLPEQEFLFVWSQFTSQFWTKEMCVFESYRRCVVVIVG